jgi:hypothetical protein
LAETTVGIAHGMRTAARSRPRPGRWAFKVSAMTMPIAVSSATEMTVKNSVLPTAFHQSGSSKR